MSLHRVLLAGPEECSQGGSELSSMEGTELPRAQGLAAPGAEHPAHDGPGRAADPEGGLAGKRGRGNQGRAPGQRRGQQLMDRMDLKQIHSDLRLFYSFFVKEKQQ